MTNPAQWTTCELFDYLLENGELDEDATFGDHMHNRSDLLSSVIEHLDNNPVEDEDGTSGQDRDSYTDDQDRTSYTVSEI